MFGTNVSGEDGRSRDPRKLCCSSLGAFERSLKHNQINFNILYQDCKERLEICQDDVLASSFQARNLRYRYATQYYGKCKCKDLAYGSSSAGEKK